MSRILAEVVETLAKGEAAPVVSLLPVEPTAAAWRAFASLLALALAIALLALDALRPLLLVAKRADDEEDVAAGIRDASADGAEENANALLPNSRMEHAAGAAAAATTSLILRNQTRGVLGVLGVPR